jgi:hypothetical protein
MIPVTMTTASTMRRPRPAAGGVRGDGEEVSAHPQDRHGSDPRRPVRGRRGCDEQFEFEFALDLLLDGFERLRDQGWTSQRDRERAAALPAAEQGV